MFRVTARGTGSRLAGHLSLGSSPARARPDPRGDLAASAIAGADRDDRLCRWLFRPRGGPCGRCRVQIALRLQHFVRDHVGAAERDAATKEAYFRRYLDDPRLNEEWVTASLGAFNDPAQASLSLPWLRPSLDRLEWIRDNRRIFFLPRWINAFIGG